MKKALIVVPTVAGVAGYYLAERKEYKTHTEGIVLITGASTGIGRHAAEHLANNHKYTVLAGVRKESDAQNIRDMKIKNLQPIILDVSQHDSCVTAVSEIQKLMKDTNQPFVALVNNAGVSTKMPVEHVSAEDAKNLFNTNFFGLLDITQLTLPLLRESKGRVVNISSVAGLVARSYSSMYTASKFAVEGFSDTLRREMEPFGVSVSIIEPAFVKTSIFTTSESKKVVAVSQISPEKQAIYPDFYAQSYTEKYDKIFAKADPPTVTTNAIVDAIVSSTPKTRYPVANANGIPAWLAVKLTWLFSDRINDAFVKKAV